MWGSRAAGCSCVAGFFVTYERPLCKYFGSISHVHRQITNVCDMSYFPQRHSSINLASISTTLALDAYINLVATQLIGTLFRIELQRSIQSGIPAIIPCKGRFDSQLRTNSVLQHCGGRLVRVLMQDVFLAGV